MEILTDSEFRKRIKKSFTPGYFFFGEEDYLKSYAAKLLRDTVCGDGGNAEFNCLKLNVLDYTPNKLIEALAPLPMFGEKKLIELTGLDFTVMRPDDTNAFFDALALLKEFDYNTLLISVADGCIDEGRLPAKPSAVLEKLGEFLTVVRFEKCTPARLCDWVGKHFEHNGVKTSPGICAKIIDYCGRSMFTLTGEIDKVSFYALSHGRTEVAESDILEAAVPDSNYDAFAFANALTACDRSRALSILNLMKQRRIEPVIIMGEVTRVFGDLLSVRMLMDEGLDNRSIGLKLKMHEYRVGLYSSAVSGTTSSALSRVLNLCAEADESLKLSPTGYTAVELLVCSL